MKVYVDGELPKSCKECFFCEHIEEDIDGKGRNEVACYFESFLTNVLLGDTFNAKHCQHLLSLADYTKQVRKEVVQEAKQKLCRIEDTLINLGNGKEDALHYFVGILDQLRGEDK